MNDSVTVFSENERGREAADHSADVINGDTACNGYTNMTNTIVQFTCQWQHNAIDHHKMKRS